MIKLEEISYDNQVVLTIGLIRKNKSIVLFDRYNNEVQLGYNGMTLKSDGNINICSKSNINIEGSTITVKAKTTLDSSAATTRLSSDGITEVKGSLVSIN